MNMSVAAPPGLLIAAPRSGSGKTTLTLGLMRAARQRGRRVLGAKCGPDYIDPAFHAAATGRPGLNLDSWAMEPSLRHALVAGVAQEGDLILCEGLMGLFDGVPAEQGRSGSSADIAAAFGWPVVLILDVSGQSQSAAATALGCAMLDPRLTIAGVVLNRIGSVRHQMLATQAIESVGLPVLGALRRAPEITLRERHLGLVQAGETAELDLTLDRLAGFIETQIAVDRLRSLAVPSRVEDFASADLLRTVVESCPTKLFLANPALDRRSYADLFQLNDMELDLLTGLIPRQQILLKRQDLAKVLTLTVDPKSYWIYTNTPIDNARVAETFREYGFEAGLDRLAASA